jgi:UDP-glucose 4-epimerase
MVVVVTGGSGFIGSHLVDALLSRGNVVRVFDKAKPQTDGVEWFKGDLLNQQDVFDAMLDAEVIFHLAAIADVTVADADPLLCLTANEIGTLNLLRACSGADIERFVLASTVWVYGKTPGTVTEEAPIPAPDNLYTKTKIGQEHLVYSWCLSHSLPFTILRYDIPYGPRMRTNMAIASFARKAMKREPITIYGDGKQGRCWIYISDLAEANCAAMNPGASNQTVNLAGKEFVTISEIVRLLSESFGDFPVKNEPRRTNDFPGVHTSIEKAKTLLGWYPGTSFKEGLAKYLKSVQHG